MLNFTIRNARREDLHRIVEIYNSTVPLGTVTADTEPVTTESREHWFNEHQNQNRPLWIAEQDNIIMGWLSFKNFYGRPAYIHTAELSIYLDPAYRRKGIGKILLTKAITTSPQLNIQTLLAFIFHTNTISLDLFKKYDFEQWGCFPQVAEIQNEKRDLIILGKKII